MTKVHAVLPLAEGVEEMEAVIVADVLRRAGAEVRLLALDEGVPVKASRGVGLHPDGVLTGEEEAELLVLPGGGEGAKRLAADERVLGMIRRFAEGDRWVAAICAAPIALAAAGVLEGRTATSHPSVKAEVAKACGKYTENPVEVDGRLVTSRGPGTAFDFALDLCGLLFGAAKAAEVRKPMMFPIDG
ncbi:MAG: DJ-1/PfpI family protein [Planctomycetota bacterium]